MTAELVRGQNHPLPHTRLEVRVSAGHPVVACASYVDDRGTGREEWVAHPGARALPGVEVPGQADRTPRFVLQLDAVPEAVQQINVLLALAGGGGPDRFGATAAPFVAVVGDDGDEIASFTITGLDTETALVAVEVYRRQGAWKIRAVGQGYEGGLADLLADQGLARAREVAAGIQATVALPAPRTEPARLATSADAGPAAPAAPDQSSAPEATPSGGRSLSDGLSVPAAQAAAASAGPQHTPGPDAPQVPSGPVDYTHPRRQSAAPPPPPAAPPAEPGRPSAPVAGDATGWSMEERLYNQIWGMFEDLARTVAAYRSAVEFAENRMDKELDQVLSDPRSRIGSGGDAARAAARAKYEQLTDQARQVLDRDLAQLTAEAEVVEPALPPAFARWDNPVWHAYRVPMEIPMALRIGDIHLPESPELRLPLLVRLPLERGLWVDSGRSSSDAAMALDEGVLRRQAADTAVALAARLVAVYPPGEFSVHVIDPAGSAAGSLAPLVGSGVLAGPPAAGAQGVSSVLARLTQRVDLVTMALRGDAADSLPPDLDRAEQLLIVNDFPHGFDDRAVTQLRYLADEGPAVGVHLLMVADREDASAYGPVLDPLWRSLLRITPVPDDHLADPWVRHAWTYEPLPVPPGSAVLRQVLDQVADARRSWGR
ncbi:TerD family protein [Streptomyces sp. PKU-EA00015]|uniref:TerD family protein n=1 Tax=Streptomyces sp. PKU-EA00015 TaxID=2748326 RepID=UPI00159FB1F6|nr:TerD family protein [Streptomyces sp. PKU-EA00015]NWF26320.1 TerD family protein [Streptomyces sp. PKU-EA00015]